jgi:hypothetical protein
MMEPPGGSYQPSFKAALAGQDSALLHHLEFDPRYASFGHNLIALQGSTKRQVLVL